MGLKMTSNVKANPGDLKCDVHLFMCSNGFLFRQHFPVRNVGSTNHLRCVHCLPHTCRLYGVQRSAVQCLRLPIWTPLQLRNVLFELLHCVQEPHQPSLSGVPSGGAVALGRVPRELLHKRTVHPVQQVCGLFAFVVSRFVSLSCLFFGSGRWPVCRSSRNTCSKSTASKYPRPPPATSVAET